MRKSLQLVLVAVLGLASSIFCADLEFGIPQKIMVGPRVGLFSASHSSQVKATPLMGLQIEAPIIRFSKTDKELFQSMGIGIQYVYESWPSTYSNYSGTVWQRKYSYSYLTFFATYYYPGLKIEKLRPFGRLGLGLKTKKVSFAPGDPEFSNRYDNTYNDTVKSTTGLCMNLSLGAKYFVVPNVVITVEFGWGISGVMLGADYCF